VCGEEGDEGSLGVETEGIVGEVDCVEVGELDEGFEEVG
jgi:hypothetical protein